MSIPGNPWISLALAAAIASASFGSAWSWRGALCEAAAAAKVSDSQARKDNEAGKAHDAAVKLEVSNADANKVDAAGAAALAAIVRRPLYSRACIDDDGLRLIRAAFTGASAAAPEPDLPMPRPDAP